MPRNVGSNAGDGRKFYSLLAISIFAVLESVSRGQWPVATIVTVVEGIKERLESKEEGLEEEDGKKDDLRSQLGAAVFSLTVAGRRNRPKFAQFSAPLWSR